MAEWRLTRKADTVFALLLLPNQTLPRARSLSLPFVVDVPGGVDGTWPHAALQSVALLGHAEVHIPFTWDGASGLHLAITPAMEVAAPYVATFALRFAPSRYY